LYGPLKQWLAICCLGLVLAGTPVSISSGIVSADRWTLMMAIPLAIFAAEIPRTTWRFTKPKFPRMLWAPWLLLMLVLGGAYLVLPAQIAFPYYQFVAPTSMLQSTVPLADSHDLTVAISWLSANIQPGAVIMTHHAMYGWVREYFRGSNTVLGFSPSTNLDAALRLTIQQGYSKIYTVWWMSGSGWYGQTVPQGFVPVHSEGEMTVYFTSTHT